ncbi:MAG: hypothetical protein IKB68_01795 [Rikenellaceae bacterium]|nr:hypothetical protein [Rikenellaceae bacterium]
MKTSNKLLILFVAILAVVWSAEWWIGYRTVAPFHKLLGSEQMEAVRVYKMPHNTLSSLTDTTGYLKHKVFEIDRSMSVDDLNVEGDTLTFNYEMEAIPFSYADTITLVLADTTLVYSGPHTEIR